jgi:predicted trehalose synthase
MFAFDYQAFGAMLVIIVPVFAAGIAMVIKALHGVKDAAEATGQQVKDKVDVGIATAAAQPALDTSELAKSMDTLSLKMDRRLSQIDGKISGLKKTQADLIKNQDDALELIIALDEKMTSHIEESLKVGLR